MSSWSLYRHAFLTSFPGSGSLPCQHHQHSWASELPGHSMSRWGFGQPTKHSESSHGMPGKPAPVTGPPFPMGFRSPLSPWGSTLSPTLPVQDLFDTAMSGLCCPMASSPSIVTFRKPLHTSVPKSSMLLTSFRLASCPGRLFQTLAGICCFFQDILLLGMFSDALGNHLICLLLCLKAIAKIFIFPSPKRTHQVLKSFLRVCNVSSENRPDMRCLYDAVVL